MTLKVWFNSGYSPCNVKYPNSIARLVDGNLEVVRTTVWTYQGDPTKGGAIRTTIAMFAPGVWRRWELVPAESEPK